MIQTIKNTFRLMRLLGTQKAEQILQRIPHPSQFNLGFLFPGTEVDYGAKVGTGLGSNVLLAPILYIARVFPEAKLVIKTDTKGEEELDANHPLVMLLRQPNPFYSGVALMLATLLSWFLDGNAYWFKVRGASGQVVELWYVPHWMIEPEGDATTFITGYKYLSGRQQAVTILPKNVVHFRNGIDPNNVRKGFSSFKTVLREVFSDDEAGNLVAALLVNRGIPGMIIAPDKDVIIGDGDIDAMKNFIKDKFTGSKRGEPMMLEASIKVHEFGFNPKELDLSSVHNLAEERVCALIGLPAAIVGFGTGMEQTKVGATLKELRQLAWTDCINPTQNSLAADLTRSLGPDFGLKPNQTVAYDRSKVLALQDNLDKQSERLDRGVRGGWVQVAEAREASSLDVDDSHRVFLRGLNIIEVDGSGNEVVRAVPAEPKKAKQARRLTTLQIRAIRVMDRTRAALEAVTLKELTKFFEDFGAQVERVFLELFDPKAAGDELDVDLLFRTMGIAELEGEISGLFSTQYLRVHSATSEPIAAAVGIGVNLPNNVEQEIINVARRRASLVNLTKDARRQAFDILVTGREAGEGVRVIARELREVIPAGRFRKTSTRAKLIARTETRFAQNESALRTYENMEGATGVQMVDARLGETDADCESVNGRIVSFDEGRQLIDDEHPNGTRDMVPHFGEIPGDTLLGGT